ncbi:MAG: ATP-binding cassette domain-containing protein, partial [Spirochaetaceae bacterium]|jgi:putative ATP-binding cassette transporter|nr:ATP-binding cassette domain-containing protein [Spirochaetaceae bacterium]
MSTLDFIKFLTAHVGKKKNPVIIISVVNGLCMISLMYSLQIGLGSVGRTGTLSIRGFLLFLCSLAAYYVTQSFAVRTASGAAYTAIEDLELRLIDKLRRIDYTAFKTISPSVLYAALGGDKNTVVNAARLVITAFSGAVTIAIAIMYMATLSVTAVLLIIIEYCLVVFVYKIQSGILGKRFEADAQAASAFTSSLEDMVNGFAELKMSNLRSEELYEKTIKPASGRKTECFKQTELHWVRLLVLNQAGLFIPLGLIVFIVPALAEINLAGIVEILTVTLIITAPAGLLSNFVSAADAANNTLLKIGLIEKQLDAIASGETEEDLAKPPLTPDFSLLEIKRLKFSYPGSGDQKGFSLDIENFSLKKGELVIIKGGNGSGKSTFMYLLAGLLPPGEGDILVDGTPASSLRGADYRSLFSILFADFHLFDDFYGFNFDKKDLDYWAERLKITEFIKSYEQTGKLPATALSSGQRKRMALLAVILENRKVLLLDEVAADFDPEFRDRYYREIIPELKAAGRTLILVSHDDRYYDGAGRVLEFREGTIFS